MCTRKLCVRSFVSKTGLQSRGTRVYATTQLKSMMTESPRAGLEPISWSELFHHSSVRNQRCDFFNASSHILSEFCNPAIRLVLPSLATSWLLFARFRQAESAEFTQSSQGILRSDVPETGGKSFRAGVKTMDTSHLENMPIILWQSGRVREALGRGCVVICCGVVVWCGGEC